MDRSESPLTEICSAAPAPAGDLAGELMTLAELARRLPGARRGKPLHVATIYRWCESGRLEYVICGGRRMTTMEAFRRFIEDGTREHREAPRKRRKRSKAQRERARRQAEKRLDRAGIA